MNVLVRKMLDQVAISMVVVCGIHCLVTPAFLMALPILATTVWVNENFHLWMLLFVIPTTSLAVWSGCRRHKDKWVVVFTVLGIGILFSALIAERIEHAHEHGDSHTHLHDEETATDEHVAAAGCCELHPAHDESSPEHGESLAAVVPLTWHALLNTLGGCFLIAGHVRNFLLCRKDNCSHGEVCGTDV